MIRYRLYITENMRAMKMLKKLLRTKKTFSKIRKLDTQKNDQKKPKDSKERYTCILGVAVTEI